MKVCRLKVAALSNSELTMFRQEVDPLADTLPPRYAYESDEEDELEELPSQALEGSAGGSSDGKDNVTIDVRTIIGDNVDIGEGRPLIVASGDVGVLWARGARLGQQVGQVFVNKRAIGFVYRPEWTPSSVIISEALSRLPIWAMHPYAEAVVAQWKPSSIVLLDAYSVATYVSATPIPYHEAPLRFLSSGEFKSPADTRIQIEPFAPPNLLQTTSAAFASILAFSETDSSPAINKTAFSTTTILLVPSSHAPKPAPHLLHRIDEHDGGETTDTALYTSSREASEDWDTAVLRAAHTVLLGLIGVEPGNKFELELGEESVKDGEGSSPVVRRRMNVDSSMYI